MTPSVSAPCDINLSDATGVDCRETSYQVLGVNIAETNVVCSGRRVHIHHVTVMSHELAEICTTANYVIGFCTNFVFRKLFLIKSYNVVSESNTFSDCSVSDAIYINEN